MVGFVLLLRFFCFLIIYVAYVLSGVCASFVGVLLAMRIGIGNPGEKFRVTGHVLQNFSKDDLAWFKPMLDAMVEAAPLLDRKSVV